VSSKKALLYRMVTEQHICPFGIKSLDLLEKKGFEVEDHHLTNREETDNFKELHSVQTTPQTFIYGKRIGGHDALVEHFNAFTMKQEGVTYQPVIAVFATSFLMAVAQSYSVRVNNVFHFMAFIKTFIAFSMCILAILKLRDLFSFSNQFITYDLVAKKYIGYSYLYPFLEVLAGIGMIAGVFNAPVGIISLSIGSAGAVSVVKAVYIEKRDIKCACVGGDSNVPLGAISLTENLMMVFMGIVMLVQL